MLKANKLVGQIHKKFYIYSFQVILATCIDYEQIINSTK